MSAANRGTANARWTTLLASAIGALVLAACLPALVLLAANRDVPEIWSFTEPANLFGAIVSGVVGTVVAIRRPANAIGWLLLASCVLGQIAVLLTQIGVYGLETRPGAAHADLALWIGVWFGLAASVPATVLLLLLFPTGRFQGGATRVVAALSGIALVLQLLGMAAIDELPPGVAGIYERTPNPLRVLGRAGPVEDPGAGFALMALCLLLSVALLLVRFRRARGIARQQYKWVVLAMAFVVVASVGEFVAIATGMPVAWLLTAVPPVAEAMVPVAIGVAILRYRLFSIDRVISRALVYATLTAVLLGTYALGVVMLQAVLAPLTGGSDIAIAGTTLLVAVLVRPLRARIQNGVDRRFNRAHYDAMRTIHAFSQRMRDEIDLDAIGTELRVVADQTMQPTSVSLWLRPPATS